MSEGLRWILVAVLLAVEGFYSGSEIALLSADKMALKKAGGQGILGAKRALELAKRPERILSITLLMVSGSVILLSSLIAERFPESEVTAVAIASALVVFFGELIPKTLFRRFATQLAPIVAYPLTFTYYGLYPLTRLLSLYTQRVSRVVGPMEALLTGTRRTTRDDLRTLIDFSKRDSDIKTAEKKMIKRILDFRYTEAQNALIPLVKVDALEDVSTVADALEEFQRHRHSRIPVFSERVDNIVGILEFFDLFSVKDLNQPVSKFMTRPLYVANTQNLPDVLDQLHENRKEMAVVVDEHGGAVGVVTYEDIFEEIGGDVEDEYDHDSTPYRALSETSWVVQARVEIPALNEALKIEIPEGDYETLGGFLLKQFGRIPQSRDELYFNTPTGFYRFTIRIATARHIDTVLIEQIESKS